MKPRLVCVIAILISVLISKPSRGQHEVDEMSLINFENGVGFYPPDSNFAFNIRFRMQNRIGLTTRSINDLHAAEIEAMVKRLRLRFDGYILRQKLTYSFQISFTRYDQDWDRSHTPNILRDAMIYYRFGKNFYAGFGQGKLPGNRQRVISSGQQQFIDRSLANNTFHIDRDFGLFLYYTLKTGTVYTNLKTAVSTGEGRVGLTTDDGLAWTARLEILPLGQFEGNGDYSEGDIRREPTPKISVGGGIHYNDRARKTGGEYGDDLFARRDLTSMFGDVLFKYKGWSFSGEYLNRSVRGSAFTYNEDGTDSSWIYQGYGYNAQLSYNFRRNYEIALRYSAIQPGFEISYTEPATRYYTAGLNKYFREHRLKAQFNATYRQSDAIRGFAAAKSDWLFQVQVELGI